MNTIDCQVIMLPTDKPFKKGNLFKHNGTGIINIVDYYRNPNYPTGNTESEMITQHLYFTSDEEIKKDDCKLNEWYVHFTFGEKILQQATAQDLECWEHGHTYGNKVVASTDPSLGLPSIPESFLKKYVAANGKIDKVKLRTEKRKKRDVTVLWNMKNSDWIEDILEVTISNEVVIVDIEPKLEKDCQAWYGWLGYDCHTPCNCPLIPIVTKKDASLNDGEDINDASMRTYLEALEQIKEGFLNEERAEELISLLKKPENKELEDAVKILSNPLEDKGYALFKEYFKKYPKLNLTSGMFVNIFEEGANWQKQQSVNEPKCATFIKCFDVANLCEQCKSIGQCKVVKSVENTFKEQSANEAIEFADYLQKEGWNGIINSWYNLKGLYKSTKELYELWQKSKNN
jgi:hypothetical protein